MNSSASASSSPVVTPGRMSLAQQRERGGDDLAGGGHQLDLGLRLADDHLEPGNPPRRPPVRGGVPPPARAHRRSPPTPRRASGRRGCRRRSREAGSSRSAAPSRGGRSRAASRSPRGCRPCGPPPRHGRAASPCRPRPAPGGRARRRAAGRAPRAARRAPRPGRRCAGSRRGRTRPAASSSESRSRIRPIVSSSGTRAPDARMGSTSRPSGVPAAIAARNISPVAMCGMPYSAAMRAACVPLPDPCGPRIRTFSDKRVTSGSPRSCASSSATPSGASCRARHRP